MTDLINGIVSLQPESIIFGGLTIVALALVSVVWKSNKYYFNHTNDVIKDNATVMREVAVSHQKLADANSKLAEVIDRWHSKNGG